MPNNIACPSCGNLFDAAGEIAAEIEKKYREEYRTKLRVSTDKVLEERRKFEEERSLFEEKKKKENEIFSQRIQQERARIEAEVSEQNKKLEETLSVRLTKSISSNYENQLRILKETNDDAEEKIKESRKKELEYLQKEKRLKDREEEMELLLEKKLQEERALLSEQIRKQENERNELKENELMMKLKEREKQLEDQKKLVDEMRRKAEQGSMQLQGEVQELLLEKILRDNFPFDSIEEVGKGVEGADCIHLIRTEIGKDCGKIIYESKRTKGWNDAWITKLKADMRSKGADIAILVTQAYPKGMTKFGERDGIWICSFTEVVSVSAIIRSGIIRLYELQKSEENKGDKMQLLYNYLTGNEFRGQVEAIAEGFLLMKNSISKERLQMEKLWKEREKQLEKVLISTSGMYGSVKGIAGASISNIPLLDGTDENSPEWN